MVSKNELLDQLDASSDRNTKLRQEILSLKRDNAAHRARESARMQREHAEQQRKLQEAEREDKRKRRHELNDGMLRLKDASEWAIVSDERGKVLELTVPLTADVEPIVHGVLTKTPEIRGAALGVDWQEGLLRTIEDQQHAMSRYALRHGFIAGRA